MRSPNPRGIPVFEIGRDVNGRFRPHNKGGPGNPFARKVASLRKTLLDCVSEDDLKVMIGALKEQAMEGDKAAIKLILEYCVGKPESPKDPDRMDIDEWERLQEMRVGHEQFTKTVESIPACLACHQAAVHWPCTIQDNTDHFAREIHSLDVEMKGGDPNQPLPAPRCEDDWLDEPIEPIVATPAPCPAPAQPSPTTDAREPRRASQPLTQPPSPNGGIHDDRSQSMDPPPPPTPPPSSVGQTQRKPPPR